MMHDMNMNDYYKSRAHELLWATCYKYVKYTGTYRKILKFLDTRKISVIILKFQQCGSTME